MPNYFFSRNNDSTKQNLRTPRPFFGQKIQYEVFKMVWSQIRHLKMLEIMENSWNVTGTKVLGSQGTCIIILASFTFHKRKFERFVISSKSDFQTN